MSGRGGGFGRAARTAGATGGGGRGRGFMGPSRDFTPVPKERRGATLHRIVAFFRPYRVQVTIVIVAILATSLLGIINPILLKLLIDQAIPNEDFAQLNLFVGLMIAVPIVSGLIGVGQSYLSNVVGQDVMQDMRNALYTHLQRMPLRFFTETRTGEIQSRLANDVGGVQSVVTDTASSITSNVAVVVSTIIAMLFIDWRLTLLSIGLTPFFLFLTYRVGKVRRSVSTETQQALAELSATTEETLSVSGILLTKTFGQQAQATDRFRDQSRSLARLQVRQAMVGRWFFMLIGTVFSITPAFVYWLSGVLVIQGDPGAPTIGDIVAFTTLQSRLFFPMGQLLNVQVEIQGALALFDRIFEYLDMDPEITDAPDAVALDPGQVRGRLRFHGVSFRYPAAPVPSARALSAVAQGDRLDELEPEDGSVATEARDPELLLEIDDSTLEVAAIAERAEREAIERGAATAADREERADAFTRAALPTASAFLRSTEDGGSPFELAGDADGSDDSRPADGDEAIGDQQPDEPVGTDDAPTNGDRPAAPEARPRTAPFALRDIDFEASPGELVALVGPSGAGKTSTTYLIPRLYDVDAGAVEIDGVDVRRIRLASLGRIIGFVTQETYLFHASIRDNLRYARPDATEAQLVAATTAAAIHDRIAELPEGYDTIVGERGYKLSGGEKQRIAIARVLLKDPRILILDEATSALDTVSERLIQSALERLMEGRTTVAIAHRLSTILRADRILVYERGRIVERGTHAELLARNGVYARLYREQFLTAPDGTPLDEGPRRGDGDGPAGRIPAAGSPMEGAG